MSCCPCVNWDKYHLGIGEGVGKQGRGNQPPYRRYGPDTEIQHRPREPHGLAKTSRILPKREADSEFQYQPHIVDTDTDCGRHFCGRHFRDSHISIEDCGQFGIANFCDRRKKSNEIRPHSFQRCVAQRVGSAPGKWGQLRRGVKQF